MLIEVKIDEKILFNAMFCKVVKETVVTSKENVKENHEFKLFCLFLKLFLLIFHVHPLL